MPIGIVSDDDFAAEIERLKQPKRSNTGIDTDRTETNEPNRIEKEQESQQAEIKTNSALPRVELLHKGRGTNNVEVPEELRALIASTAIESGRTEALALAREFGISPSSVSAYCNGATSTASYNNPDPVLKKKVNNTKERLGRVARGKLALSLRHITEDKLADAKLRDVAAVASSMAAVVKAMEPEKETASQVNIVLYAPKLRSESAFEVIDAESVE